MTLFHREIIILYVTNYPPNPMPVSYYNSTLNKYRITLELDVLDDINPRQINWEKVLDIGENESVVSYTEELDISDEWL